MSLIIMVLLMDTFTLLSEDMEQQKSGLSLQVIDPLLMIKEPIFAPSINPISRGPLIQLISRGGVYFYLKLELRTAGRNGQNND